MCQTQVFAGWPAYVGGTTPTTVDAPQSFARFKSAPAPMMAMAAPAPPPPPPPSLDEAAQAVQVTLQPPLDELEQTACVVYALLP